MISQAFVLLVRVRTVVHCTVAALSSRPAASQVQPSSISSISFISSTPHLPHPSLLDPLPDIVRRRLPFPVPQVLHLVRRHQAPLHATAQVVFAKLAALRRVDSAGGLQAAKVLLHQRLAFGVVVQREGAFGRRVGAADFDAGAGSAEGRHFERSV